MSFVEPSPTPPASFEPCDSSNGTPGDAEELGRLGQRYADTASEIETQVANLRRLSNESANFWKGAAAGTFKDNASDLAGRIDKARGRYEAAAKAANGFAAELAGLQATAYGHVRDAQAAQAAMRQNDPSTAPAQSNPPTDAEKTAAKTRSDAYSTASANLRTAESRYHDAVSNYKSRAKYWAGVLGDGLHDGLNDGFWDRHFHFLQELAKWIGVVVLVIVVAALIIATAGVFAEVMVLGMSLVTFLNVTAAALTAVMLAAHTILWKTGHGSLTDVVIDIVSLATFGLGPALGAVARTLGSSGEGIAGAVAAGRAGRSAFGGGSVGSLIYRLASGSESVRSLVSLSSKGTAALARADAAASDALSAIKSLSSESTALQRLVTFGDENLSGAMAKIGALNDAVPGVLRLQGLQTVISGLGATSGIGNVGVLGVGVNAAIKTFANGDEPVLEPEVQAEINEIAERWSQPFAAMP